MSYTYKVYRDGQQDNLLYEVTTLAIHCMVFKLFNASSDCCGLNHAESRGVSNLGRKQKKRRRSETWSRKKRRKREKKRRKRNNRSRNRRMNRVRIRRIRIRRWRKKRKRREWKIGDGREIGERGGG